MQMPDATFFGDALAKAIANGQVPQSRLDDMVLRILTAMYMVGIMDTPQVREFSTLRCFNVVLNTHLCTLAQTGNLSDDVRSREHAELARRLSEHSTVLLKNDRNILPIVRTPSERH
jgi:beta-glucosidase